MMEFITLKSAKEWLRSQFEVGAECPCCGQFVKRYKRKINSSMAYGLILIYKSNIKYYFHLEDFFKSLKGIPSTLRGDVPKLRHWGLIEKKEGEREDGNPNVGYYKITQLGIDFVEGKVRIKKWIKLYNKKSYGSEGEVVSINECLGNKFNYNELMRGE